MTNFNEINSFIQVVEHNSFKAAAQNLNVSPAHVSQQIKRLEKHIGIQLLLRSTRRLQLTEAGQRYYQHCKKIQAEVTELESFVDIYNEEPQGLLRITYGNYFGEHVITPLIPGFMQKYPKLRLQLFSGEHYEMLAEDKTDILFGMIAPMNERWIQRRVISTRYVICSAPSYFKKHGVPTQPNDLIQHQYIAHSRRPPPISALDFNNTQRLLLNPIAEIDDGRDMINLAVNGLGIIKAPDFMVKGHLQSGRLVEVLQDYCIKDLPVFLYYKNNEFINPKVRCFIDFMLNNLE